MMKRGRKIAAALLLAGLAFGISGCMKQDLDEIRKELQEQEERIAALEEWQKSVNSDILSLKSLIEAIEGKDFVTSVKTLEDGTGYVITFANSGDITIKHGEKGDTPIIGAKQDTDGKYYWTVNGEWLPDYENRIPVTGDKGKDAIAPEVRINPSTNEWEISIDNGTTWTSTGVKATGDKGDSFFEYVTVDEESGYIEFKIQGNDAFRIPVSKNRLAFSLGGTALTDLDQVIDISDGDLTYEILGDGAVSARILEGDGWKAGISDKTIEISGKIGEFALLELTLADNGKVIETYRLNLTQSSFTGKGTSAEPYMISSKEELQYLAKQVNSGTSYANQHFLLMQNIDLAGTEIESIGTVRTGAVASGKAFQGTFNGNMHTIYNIKLYTTDEKLAQGLFGFNLGTIENLIIENASIQGMNSQGALAGDNRGTIKNCHVRGNVSIEGSTNIGGLAGTNYKDNETMAATIMNCSVSGNVTVKGTNATNGIGGVVGYNTSGRIIACRFQGKLSATGVVCSMGGIVGYNSTLRKSDESEITACYSHCEFENLPDTPYAGGVAGTNNDFGTNKATACYSIVKASNIKNIGGVCGKTGEFINECYWKKSGTGTYPKYGIDNFYDSYYNPGMISDTNAMPVNGDSWSDAMAAMNEALSKEECEYNYKENNGEDSAIFPLTIEMMP